jgi:16S rRNA (guanine527-N7)-methyltransferase
VDTAQPGIEYAHRAAEWAGFGLSDDQVELLEAFADWLLTEAIPAGGLGPREGARIWPRHIADAVTFAAPWDATPPAELLDVGSGVGLPGIPLGILWPECHVTLLDRGGRRTRLLRRIVRILALDHVQVAQGDVFDVADQWEGLAFRGSVPPPEAVGLSGRLLAEGGVAVHGLSRQTDPPDRARDLVGIAGAIGMTAEVRPVPTDILDAPSWLLIMRNS